MNKSLRFGFVFILVMLGLLGTSPVEHIADLVAKWDAYNKEYPQVRVHLVFNQPKYAIGDTAFFKTFFLFEDFRPVGDKQILTLELKDKGGNIIHAQNLRVTNGEGSNQIIFPETMAPGVYSITVYSEWMKNFDPALFFKKDLLVTGRKKLLRELKEADTLSFYGEGGSIIEAVQNRIIVKSTRQGLGKVLDQNGGIVREFQIDAHGMADFMFTPQAGVRYYGILDGVGKKFQLITSESGCALRVTPQGSAGVELFVAAPSSISKQDLYFIALSKGRVTNSLTINLEQGKATIPVGNLHPGLNQFYLFDRNNNVLVERIYYVTPSTANALIVPEQEMVAPRELVSAEVAITDEGDRSLGGSFTTRVIADNLFQKNMAASFETELNLFNDLPGLKRDFEESNLSESIWLSRLDDYLISQHWLRIDWKEVFTPTKRKIKHPFKYSLDLKGKGLLMPSGDPVPDSTQVIIYQQKAMVGYETYTAKDGNISFPFLYDFFGTDHIFYTMEFRKKQNQSEYKFVPELVIKSNSSNGSEETDEIDVYGEYKFKKKLIDKSFTFFISPNKEIEAKAINPNIEFEDELGGVDVTIKVDDYLVFPTMADLIHEVITGLQTRQSNGGATVRVVFIRNTYTVIPKGDPLYIIDGIFTKNTPFFLNLNPEDIYAIKLVSAENKLQRFGELGKYGIVMVQTKKSIARQVIESSTMFPLSGLSNELVYKTPIYSGAPTFQKPDLRSSLYWNSKINTGSNGKAGLKFYTSDDASPITIEVMGITNDGRIFSANKTIQIKAPEIRP